MLYIFPYNMLTKGENNMPDISRFKSVSVSTGTHQKLTEMASSKFGVPVSVQKIIDYLIEKEIKKKHGRSNGKARS